MKHLFALTLTSLFLAGATSVQAGNPIASDCTLKGKKLYGKIQIVENFPDIKAEVVDAFPDLKVQHVEHFPDSCGQWQIVEHFPDTKVQLVQHFGDIKIQFVKNFPGKP